MALAEEAETEAVVVDGEATYTMEEVAAHSSKDDCWVVVSGGVCE